MPMPERPGNDHGNRTPAPRCPCKHSPGTRWNTSGGREIVAPKRSAHQAGLQLNQRTQADGDQHAAAQAGPELGMGLRRVAVGTHSRPGGRSHRPCTRAPQTARVAARAGRRRAERSAARSLRRRRLRADRAPTHARPAAPAPAPTDPRRSARAARRGPRPASRARRPGHELCGGSHCNVRDAEWVGVALRVLIRGWRRGRLGQRSRVRPDSGYQFRIRSQIRFRNPAPIPFPVPDPAPEPDSVPDSDSDSDSDSDPDWCRALFPLRWGLSAGALPCCACRLAIVSEGGGIERHRDEQRERIERRRTATRAQLPLGAPAVGPLHRELRDPIALAACTDRNAKARNAFGSLTNSIAGERCLALGADDGGGALRVGVYRQMRAHAGRPRRGLRPAGAASAIVASAAIRPYPRLRCAAVQLEIRALAIPWRRATIVASMVSRAWLPSLDVKACGSKRAMREALAPLLALSCALACSDGHLVVLGDRDPPIWRFEPPELVAELSVPAKTDNPSLTADMLETSSPPSATAARPTSSSPPAASASCRSARPNVSTR